MNIGTWYWLLYLYDTDVFNMYVQRRGWKAERKCAKNTAKGQNGGLCVGQRRLFIWCITWKIEFEKITEKKETTQTYNNNKMLIKG